ncbi:MAG: hypothetical protein R3E96_07035 [Planctomycetota bacterium]
MELLLSDSGLSLEPGEFAGIVGQPVEVDAAGQSRLQALHSLAQQVGLLPELPSIGTYGEVATQIHLRSPKEGAPQPQPAYTGAFQIRSSGVTELPPHGVGEVHLVASALGLSPSDLAANDGMSEYFEIESAIGPDGQNLLARDGVHRLTSPRRIGHFWQVDCDLELAHLLSDVTEIAELRGTLNINQPAKVHDMLFESLLTTSRGAGDLEVTLVRGGVENELRITGAGAESVQVLWAPETKDGTPLGIVNQNQYAYSGQTQATMTTSEVPYRLHVKLVETRASRQPFVLRNIPLPGHDKQPESEVALEFEGSQPVSVVFGDFEDRNSEFPRLRLRSVCHSNKSVRNVQVKLVYLNEKNKAIGDAFATLSNTDFTSPDQCFLQVGEAKTTSEPAFFMPAEVVSVQVAVQAVEFMDASRWQVAP